jgi:hypothetical protein
MMVRSVSRSTRLCGTLPFLLIAVMLLLPPLLRATARLHDGRDTPSSFRLNRGFDVPQSRWKPEPARTQCFDGVQPVAPAQAARRYTLADSTDLLEPQHEQSPDPQRGPPLTI